jgi:hypothetical protein
VALVTLTDGGQFGSSRHAIQAKSHKHKRSKSQKIKITEDQNVE